MKKLWILIPVLMITGCREKVYDRIKGYLDTIEIVDAHEHLQIPWISGTRDSSAFYFFNTVSYFPADMISSGGSMTWARKGVAFNSDSVWKETGRYYNYSRATSYHAQMMHTLRILYGFDKPFLAKDDIKPLYDKMIENNYRNYARWFDEVFHKEKFKTMLVDQYWNHFNPFIDTNYFSLVCNINSLVSLVTEGAADGKITSDKKLLKLMNRTEIEAVSLDDYTGLVDSVLQIFMSHGAVCLKNTLAYNRTIEFENVPYATASEIYGRKGSPDRNERKQLEDYLFHHIVQKAVELDLPVQIHTGYLAGNNSQLTNGDPMKLVNVLRRYPKAKFILFHGGYPWTSEYVAIGKNFSNVYLDIVWLPQISRTVAIRTFHEMLDCVPYNKFLWGGDVTEIDDAAGSLELGKEVVAAVLAERIEKGWMTEEIALEVARCIFRDNAVEIYRLRK